MYEKFREQLIPQIAKWSEAEHLSAVKAWGELLSAIPSVERTPKVIFAALPEGGVYISSAQETKMRDSLAGLPPEEKLSAVKENGYAVRYIKLEHQTLEMAIEAVKQEPYLRRDLTISNYSSPNLNPIDNLLRLSLPLFAFC